MDNKVIVSIIIPAKDEGEHIRSCLDSIFRLDFPPSRFEVLVVDNGSVDDTKVIASQYPVKIFDFPGARIGAVRNKGAKEAQGEVLAYVDADCIVPPCWISTALDNLAQEDVAAVGGLAIYREHPNWLERAWALKKEVKRSEVKSLATGSFVVKRDVFQKVGGFKEGIVAGEDTEISRSIGEAGFKLILEPNLSVIHLGYPRTIREFVRRQVWQTSDYLKTLNSNFDKVFFLTNVFLFCFILSPLLLAFGMLPYGAFLLLVMTAIPCLVAAIKLFRSVERKTLSLFLQVCFVHLLYFAGRSVGLLTSYKRYLVG